MSICKVYSFFLSLFRGLILFVSLIFLFNGFVYIVEYEIISLNSRVIYFSLLFDWISLIFLRYVFFISSIVIFYRDDYMEGDLYKDRFIVLVMLFVLSIMFSILSPNLIRILLGWDGLGLISYCLVIYYQNIKAYNSGIIIALSNRVGDVALLISIAWMLNYGRWNFLLYLDFMKDDFNFKVIVLLILIASFTKRAQIPFSAWLPAAIAAPTPVSSLVHSSTLVTAGVYLLIRFREGLRERVWIILLFISSLTMFIAGLVANFEYDLKKIIAFSTLSQLGLMIRILGLGERILFFFYLLIHALFKALLFICAGCIIHRILNCQDIRYIGSLVNFIPLTRRFFNICNLFLCGLPFLAGFYSKDLILEFISISYIHFYIYFIFYISTGLTVIYTFRLIYYTIVGGYGGVRFFSLSDSRELILKGMGGFNFFCYFWPKSYKMINFSNSLYNLFTFINKADGFSFYFYWNLFRVFNISS